MTEPATNARERDVVLHWMRVRGRISSLRAELHTLEKQETELRVSALRLLAPATPRLTRRQTEVLEQVLLRRSNKEIGAALYISERTAKFHVSALLRIFKVQNRIDLMRTILPERD